MKSLIGYFLNNPMHSSYHSDVVTALLQVIEIQNEALEFYAQPWERGEYGGDMLVRRIESYDGFIEVHSVARETSAKAKAIMETLTGPTRGDLK